MGLLGVALYVEDEYLGEQALRVALDQVALLKAELESTPQLALCRTFAESRAGPGTTVGSRFCSRWKAPSRWAMISICFTFFTSSGCAPSRSPTRGKTRPRPAGSLPPAVRRPTGLTNFGRELVQECERLGIILDLAHINPAGFEEICALTKRPLIVSHSNARRYYDMERNISDEQIKMIGARGGVIGINAILVSPKKEEATLDRYVDHIEHVASLIGIEGVGIGFDFCEFLWRQLPDAEREAMQAKLTTPHFLPDLGNHSHARNLTRKLIERGFSDEQIEKILRDNWLRVLRQLL